MSKKRGNSIISMPIILIISSLLIIYLGIFIINNIVPFIWYEKINNIALKYMFVIENYGYLKEQEMEMLLSDMEQQGFDIQKVTIEVPNEQKDYGELIRFSIKYDFEKNDIKLLNGKIVFDKKVIPLIVQKNSFCKR